MCFSCGRQGHGVNRCSQIDTSFPFLPPGWSVDVRNGQYRASRTDVTRLKSTPGNEGWSGREGQPSGIEVRLTPAGELGGSRRRQPAWLLPVGRERHWGAAPQRIADGMNNSCWTVLKECWEVGTQWCRSLLWRWAEVLCQWLPRCLELVSKGGGCGLLGRVGCYCSKI